MTDPPGSTFLVPMEEPVAGVVKIELPTTAGRADGAS